MRKHKVQIHRIARVSCDHERLQMPRAEFFLKFREGANREVIILRKRGNEAVAAVRAEPYCIPGQEIASVQQVDHMAPSVARHQKTLDLNVADCEDLPVPKQNLFVRNPNAGQASQTVEHTALPFAGKIAILNLAEIHGRIAEQTAAVHLDRAYVVGVEVGEQHI